MRKIIREEVSKMVENFNGQEAGMKISELIMILTKALGTHGDIPVLVPTLYNPETLDSPQDVAVLDGDNTDPDYSQPSGHPSGHYLFIGGGD
jgi:hypothetical protein